MVEDNYFMPDVPRNLWQARPNHPAIIGTNKDEYASSGKEPLSGFLYQLLELRNMRENTTKFTDYSKGFFEKELGAAFASFLGNQSKKCLNTFEQIYTQGNTKEDDHMAWLQAYVDVRALTMQYLVTGIFLGQNSGIFYWSSAQRHRILFEEQQFECVCL